MRASSPARADSSTTGIQARLRIGAQGAQQREAVEVRHHDVAEHQVGRLRRAALERGRAVADGFHRPVPPQQAREVVAHVGVVVRDQHPARGRRQIVRQHRVGGAIHRDREAARRRPDRRRPAASAAPRRRRRSTMAPAPRARGRADALGRQVRGAQPHGHRDRRAFAGRAVDAARAAVQPHQVVDEREADARAFVGARARPSMRWKRSNSRGRSRRAMPMPVSRTASRTWSSDSVSSDRHPPLERELQRVREQVEDDRLPHRPVHEHGSRAAGAASTWNSSPARSNAERNELARSAVSCVRSVGSNEAAMRPASMREKSSRAFTSFSSRSALR